MSNDIDTGKFAGRSLSEVGELLTSLSEENSLDATVEYNQQKVYVKVGEDEVFMRMVLDAIYKLDGFESGSTYARLPAMSPTDGELFTIQEV